MFEVLEDRCVVEITGKDKLSFLQGIITNDINELENKNSIFSLILTPQGKFLYEVFFFHYNDDVIYMDCFKEHSSDLLAYLSKYKLRSDVEFNIKEDYQIYWSDEKYTEKNIVETIDPRRKKIGYRGVAELSVVGSEKSPYNSMLYRICVPNCHYDMRRERSFPMEYGMDLLNAISFTKGCFVGQELTARMKHRKMVKKTLYRVVFNSPIVVDQLEDKTVYNNEQKIGEILGGEDVYGMAMIRDEEYMSIAGTSKENFIVNGQAVNIETPEWKKI